MTKKFVKLVAILVTLGLGSAYLVLRMSLPKYEGEVQIGLDAPVSISRDSLGIATFRSDSRLAISEALGFIHAQERFFQMDLLRRSAAGELAEIIGSSLVDFDKKIRIYRFRSRASEILDMLSDMERQHLKAYSRGVNKGLKALRARPPEYFLLRESPKEWNAEDSVLVGFAMYLKMQGLNPNINFSRGIMEKKLPVKVARYLTDHRSAWNSFLNPENESFAPKPDSSDYSFAKENFGRANLTPKHQLLAGSNQWSMRFKTENSYKAVLACDMHLDLSVPNLWFRTSLRYVNKNGRKIKFDGVGLPGMPIMIIGSNSNIAWGFTNPALNFIKLLVVDTDNISTKKIQEKISIKGDQEIVLEVQETEHGPIWHKTLEDKKLVIDWVALKLNSLNFRMLDLESAVSVEEALKISKTVSLPALNFMVADNEGHIAWTIMGPIAEWTNDGAATVPYRIDSGIRLLSRDRYPVIKDPVSGKLWTANNKVLSGEWSKILYSNQYLKGNGVRAKQIQNGLDEVKKPTIENMLAIQMDNEALFLKRWHRFALDLFSDPYKSNSQVVEMILFYLKTDWPARADVDSIGYTLVRLFRESTYLLVSSKLLAQCVDEDKDFDYYSMDFEEPVWEIINDKPRELLDTRYESWNEELRMNFLTHFSDLDESDWENLQWGKQNPSQVNHPLAFVLGPLRSWLSTNSQPLSGDFYMPLINRGSMGASQRMIVFPGTDQAMFHMPGGQSGHPLSPFYKIGHDDWYSANMTPLEPGKAIYELKLL